MTTTAPEAPPWVIAVGGDAQTLDIAERLYAASNAIDLEAARDEFAEERYDLQVEFLTVAKLLRSAGFTQVGPARITTEQIEAAAAAIYEIDPTPMCGDGSWAALLSAAREGTMSGAIAASIAEDRRTSARAALSAALDLDVEAGERVVPAEVIPDTGGLLDYPADQPEVWVDHPEEGEGR